MKIAEDVTTPPDVRRESDPAGVSTSVSDEALNAFANEQPNWMPLSDHTTIEHGQDVQRTLQGLALGANNLPRPTYSSSDLNSTGYVTSENSNNADAGLSPDTTHSGSNRPTPNSTTPSETRSNLQPGTNSGGNSYNTSPAPSNQAHLPNVGTVNAFFATQPDYSGINPTGFTPDNTFSLPETPGKDYSAANGWNMSQQTTGLTPVGEGVFRHLMELGVDPMDLGWEGQT